MSISSRITAMEGHISNAYDGLEDLGVDLTNVDKNIDNIASKLEEVWQGYPKVSESDETEATLNETKAGRMEIDLKGNTEQTQLTGKNLLDGANPTGANFATATMTGNTIKVSSTATNTVPHVKYEFNNVTEGDIYRLNGIIKNSIGRFVLQGYTTSWSTLITKDYVDGASISSINYQIPANVTAIRFLLYSSRSTPSGAAESNYENVIVTKNNTDMTYEPYCGGIPSPSPEFPQQIKNVTGNNNVKIQNKNLFNPNGEFENGYYNTNGSFYPSSNWRCMTVKCKQGDTFIKSGTGWGGIVTFWNNDTFVSAINSTNVTIPSGANKVKFACQYPFNGDEQLEQGTTATSYVPHQEQNLPFTLGTQRMYQGSYLADDGIHNIKTQLILGNITTLFTTTLWGTQFKYGLYTLYRSKGGGRNYNFKCNKVSPANESYGKYKGYKNEANFIVMTDVNDTVENFNSKISGSIVEYELAQEEITPYNSTQQAQYNAIRKAQSYDDQTNISQTNDELPFILDIEALKNN